MPRLVAATAPLRPVARGIVTVVAVVLLLATLAMIGLRVLGYQTFVITTGSMTGTADPGSLVIAERVPVDQLAVGDVLTYIPPVTTGIDHPVTHRLVEIAPTEDGSLSYRTKGDANGTADDWTFQLDDEPQTVMVTAIPHVGRPVLALADPGTRRLVIGVPAALIALMAAVDVVRELRRRDPAPHPAPVLDEPVLVIDLTAPAPLSTTSR